MLVLCEPTIQCDKTKLYREVRMTIKEGFYRVELINTVWEVPNRYQDLMPVGTGAFGQVNHK